MDYSKMLTLVEQICLLLPIIVLGAKLVSVYRCAAQNQLFKKICFFYFVLVVFDCYWYGCLIYKTSYRLLVSDAPQATYLWIARGLFFVWPLAIFLCTLMCDLLISAEDRLAKRHYFLGVWTVGIMGYFLYDFYVNYANLFDPWRTLSVSSFVLMNIFIIANRGSNLIYGLKKLFAGKPMPLIVEKQAKLILGLMVAPVIFLQSIWLLSNCKIIALDSLYWDLFTFVFQATFVVGLTYTFFELLRLRLFNTASMVQGGGRNITEIFNAVAVQFDKTKTIPELGGLVATYFEKAFGFDANNVTLYVRPVDYAGIVDNPPPSNTLSTVEALYCSADPEQLALCEKICQKRILVYTDVHFDEQYHLDDEAKKLQNFLEANNADVFIPIYREHALVAYVIVGRDTRDGLLVNDTEARSMLSFATYLSYVIECRQRVESKILVKKCMEHEYKEKQLYREREHCHEGMQAVAAQAKTSGAVSMILLKHNRLQVADTEGAELLGLPEGDFDVPERYKNALNRLLLAYKKFGRTEPVLQKDPQGHLLRFTPMKSPYKDNVMIIVSRPPISESITFPSFASIHNTDDWDYALFLQTTASGKLLEKFIPATNGQLFDFKIKYMRAVFARRPLLFTGSAKDAKRLATIAQAICARSKFYELCLKEDEKNSNYAIELFGVVSISADGQEKKGLLAMLSESGTLFIEHIEQLSLQTQDMLAEYIATGSYAPLFSRQITSSDVQIVFSSQVNLKNLVEKKKFSAALYAELEKNAVHIPEIRSVPRKQLQELARLMSLQTLGEEAFNESIMNSESFIEELVKNSSLAHDLSDFGREVKSTTLAYERAKKPGSFTPAVFDVSADDLNDPDSLMETLKRLGRKALKSKELFCAAINVFQNDMRLVAESLQVDPATIYRYCSKYQIGIFAPGFVRRRGRRSKKKVSSRKQTSKNLGSKIPASQQVEV